jgi:hypothetical protein
LRLRLRLRLGLGLKWNARRDATDKRVLTFRQPHRPSIHDSITATGQNCKGHYLIFGLLKPGMLSTRWRPLHNAILCITAMPASPSPYMLALDRWDLPLQASLGNPLFPFQVTSLEPFSQLYRVGVGAVGGLSRKVAMSRPPPGGMQSRRRGW